MSYTKNLLVSFIFLSSLYFTFSYAATIDVINKCTYPVWAAASPGGGKRLDNGQIWKLTVPPGTAMARVWGRTKCKFDANGLFNCETGGCTGGLECKGWGKPPNTLAEYTLDKKTNKDTIDISLVDGFNIPMEFSPTSNACRGIKCGDNLNAQCPPKLKTAGGCNNPCNVFNTVKYCCTSKRGSCGPTEFSKYFKGKCPDAYSYPQDDETSTFTCPGGTNYKVVFCP